MIQPRCISIIGSTGSVGRSTLSVVRESAGLLAIGGLAAHSNWELLLEQVLEFRPSHAGLVDEDAARQLRDALPRDRTCEVHAGPGALETIASLPAVETAVCAALGAAGIPPVVAAIRAGKTIGLANKEVLVAGGSFITALAREHSATIIPIDSEHSAILQCLRGERASEVRSLVLTASGGPFRQLPADRLAQVTRAEALKHPNWVMGEKITIDSASLMNKGLEVIEAHWLFGLGYDRIRVIVHPQSIVHSMVEFCDGSVIAQLGIADMRIPIQFAVSHPDRWPIEYLPRLDLLAIGSLTFEEPDLDRFRCLALAFQCGKMGGTFPAVLNAANEIAVDRFLQERLRFVDIPSVIEGVLERHEGHPAVDLESVLTADGWARREAQRIAEHVGPGAR
ncbi:MAG: 1-deoxy-D-xylulose-5-phosphate reductoisomerase [Candidatus Wallbacteria bacterium]|nr:1-deoxy-D-xylulose-5-phosphate reductoisomerase [Candidatus Wallbacteria bacterium]